MFNLGYALAVAPAFAKGKVAGNGAKWSGMGLKVAGEAIYAAGDWLEDWGKKQLADYAQVKAAIDNALEQAEQQQPQRAQQTRQAKPQQQQPQVQVADFDGADLYFDC